MAVTLSLDGIEPQKRLTVAFRVILAIPHWLFLFVLTLVAFVVIFLAWFAALFTARVPDGMRDFLIRVLQYQTRVYAYGALLLTDVFPPFDVGPKEYPVELDIVPTERLNRAAVFFRYWLQIPVMLLTQLVFSGISVIMFFVWLITLITARVPTSAYIVLATVLRFQMRTYAYVGMITSEYPGGLFGDRDRDAGAAPEIDDELPASPRIDRFVLTGGQKALIWLALLLGGGFTAINVAVTDWSFGRTAELADMHSDFEAAYDTWDDATRDCSRQGAAACTGVNAELRDDIERYQRRLFVFEVPESAVDDGIEVIEALDEMHGLLGEMNESGDSDEQLRLYLLVEDAKRDYDDEYDDFYSAVSFG